jgi:hypothetical protein
MAYLVQILFPVTDKEKARSELMVVKELLTAKYGVLTITSNAAQGIWDDGDDVRRDSIVVVEVMPLAIDRAWWISYKCHLRSALDQDDIVIRTSFIDVI